MNRLISKQIQISYININFLHYETGKPQEHLSISIPLETFSDRTQCIIEGQNHQEESAGTNLTPGENWKPSSSLLLGCITVYSAVVNKGFTHNSKL